MLKRAGVRLSADLWPGALDPGFGEGWWMEEGGGVGARDREEEMLPVRGLLREDTLIKASRGKQKKRRSSYDFNTNPIGER